MKFKKEKPVKVEKWVVRTIVRYEKRSNGTTDYQARTILWRREFPMWQWEFDQTKQRLNWILARFQYHNYGFHLACTHGVYDRKTGFDNNWNKLVDEYNSAKGMVTKLRNALQLHIQQHQQEGNLFSFREDPLYQKGLTKLRDYCIKKYELKKTLIEYEHAN